MTTWAVLATGPSMSQDLADSIRGRCSVIAVSDCFRLAGWADALVSQDRAWWRANAQALEFAGRKFAGSEVEGVEQVKHEGAISSGSNSGLLACHVAVKYLGATKLLLLGFDLRGTHYFGPHPAPLKNTKEHRFAVFQEQFRHFRPRGIEIVNCTAGSALRAYPKMDLAEAMKDT